MSLSVIKKTVLSFQNNHLAHFVFLFVYNRGNSNSLQDDSAGLSQDDEQPGPSRRKRQPSMSETMPLYTLCKEDLESMDKEVSLNVDTGNRSVTALRFPGVRCQGIFVSSSYVNAHHERPNYATNYKRIASSTPPKPLFTVPKSINFI